MSSEFEDALEKCINLVVEELVSVDDCLARYPHLRKELEPLLQAAHHLQVGLAPVVPSPVFEEETKARFLEAVRTKQAQQKALMPSIQSRIQEKLHNLGQGIKLRTLRAKVVVGLVIFSLLGGGTVAALANSMPSNVLYPVKLGVERAQLALTSDEYAKGELYLTLAEKRLEEAEVMAASKDIDGVKKALSAMDDNLKQAEAIAKKLKGEEKQKLVAKIVEFTQRQQAILNSLLAEAPDEAKNTVKSSLTVSAKSHKEAVKQQEKVSPTVASETPAAQSKDAAQSQVQPNPAESTSTAILEVSRVIASPEVFSPNDDRIKDLCKITVNGGSKQALRADIIDTAGKQICSNLMLAEDLLKPGCYTSVWGGTNDSGSVVSDGSYVIKIRNNDNVYTETTKTVIVDNKAPSRPMPTGPVGGETVDSGVVTFLWKAVEQAEVYTLQYSKKSDFSGDSTVTLTDLAVSIYTVPSESQLSPGTWYWRVKCTDNVGNVSSYCNLCSFSVAAPKPEKQVEE